MVLPELLNIFTKENYPPNEQNISKVPFEDVQSFMFQQFAEEGYSYEVTQVGSLSNGNNFVVLKITLPIANGKTFSFPGAADGPNMGIAGLITTAFVNGCLRQAGMGVGLYQHEPGEEPVFNNQPPAQANPPYTNANIPASPFAGANYGASYQQQQPPANQGWNNNGGGNKGGYGPWTGEVTIKSGKFQGMKWSQLPPDTILGMAQSGNNLAIKEAQRRGL